MRPIRVTGVTGNSVPVPLDVYSTAPFDYVNFETAGAPTLQITISNPFDTAVAIAWKASPVADATTGLIAIPRGVRAVRGQAMVAADVLVVSPGGLI